MKSCDNENIPSFQKEILKHRPPQGIAVTESPLSGSLARVLALDPGFALLSRIPSVILRRIGGLADRVLATCEFPWVSRFQPVYLGI